MTKPAIKVITVFLGSRTGNKPRFIAAAKRLAQILFENDITLLYGGGSVGLMGVLAQELHALGGKVIGVIPGFLFEIEKPVKYGRLIQVETMMQRKEIFFAGSIDHGIPRSDSIVTMSGAGDGTIDELAEGITLEKLLQLAQSQQPQVLVNIDNFWAGLLAQRQRMVADGFIDPEFEKKLIVVDDVEKILPAIYCARSIPEAANGGPRLVCSNGTAG